MKTIDLNEYRSEGATVLAGRLRGTACRKKAGLDELDSAEAAVEIRIPGDLIAITTSFFQAMFGDSIRSLGSLEFRRKYTFVGGEDFEDEISDGISDALQSGSILRVFV